MERTVTMPKLGMTMTEGVIVTWAVAIGDVVQKDALLGEVETDKVTLEIEAPAAGTITQLLVQPGDTVPVGDPIVVIETHVAATPTPASPPMQPPLAAAPAAMPVAPSSAAPSFLLAEVAPTPAAVPPTNGHGPPKIPSTPLARRLAAAHGVDLTVVAREGMPVRSAAVLAFVAQHAASLQQPAAAPPDHPDATITPLTTMRRIIAERTALSFATVPHIYLDTEVDMSKLEAWRLREKARGHAVSATTLLTRAVALALRAHPDLNSGFVAPTDGQAAGVVQWQAVHLSLAVAVPGGLLAPVVRHADRKSLDELGQAIQRLAELARTGKLKPDDLTGGTFSISNLGMFGIDTFHAIISAPQSAILAVGRITRQAVVIADADGSESIGIRPLMKLSLSVDHRVADGATGAQFLATLRRYLEDDIAVIVDGPTQGA